MDPQRHLDSGHDVAILRDALRSLPGQQRQVIQLRFFQELSSAEVARQLGKTEQAVYALQYRAITALREFVEQDAAFTIASPFAPPQPSPFRRVA